MDGDVYTLPDYKIGSSIDVQNENAANGYGVPAILDNSYGFGGLVNSLTGILSKSVDTAGDMLALQGAKKIVGSTYNTGQVDPAKQASALTQNKTPVNYTPWIIGGVAVLGLVIVTALITRK